MNFEDFPLDRQLEIQDRYRKCNFAKFKYEFSNDGVKLPDPIIKDRLGNDVNLGDKCIMAVSCGKSSATLSEYIFIGTLTLRQDGNTRMHPLAIMKDHNHNTTYYGNGQRRFMYRQRRFMYRLEENYDLLNVQGIF